METDYAHKAATTESMYLDAIVEYDQYCLYAASVVGEGMSRMFTASGKEGRVARIQSRCLPLCRAFPP